MNFIQRSLITMSPYIVKFVHLYVYFMSLISSVGEGHEIVIPVQIKENIVIKSVRIYNNPQLYYFCMIGDICDIEELVEFYKKIYMEHHLEGMRVISDSGVLELKMDEIVYFEKID